jgi:hypothetical protein
MLSVASQFLMLVTRLLSLALRLDPELGCFLLLLDGGLKAGGAVARTLSAWRRKQLARLLLHVPVRVQSRVDATGAQALAVDVLCLLTLARAPLVLVPQTHVVRTKSIK